MNTTIAKKRINEVLKVDSISSSQADFIATHVPFNKILIKDKQDNTETKYSEEKVYEKIFADPIVNSKHQFIIVEGSSGSGKSHFIRWLYAKCCGEEIQNDVILLIRRSDNTLKGTIKQLLNINEVKKIKNHEIYERLVKVNQTMREAKFKDSIIHSFLVELKNDETDCKLSVVQRKNLYALLSNSLFQERMLSLEGPIERIYSKLVTTDIGTNQDTIPLFNVNDFTLDTDFGEQLQLESADIKAIKMVNRLIPESEDGNLIEVVTNYMNTLVDNVIQSCIGIETGDFQQIFHEIRKELFEQNKNLILLIEDITSFTGINQALLNVLVTEHTGMNETEKICKLISVVGTTSEYYKQFRDNYKDRITTQITIEDGIIGSNKNDLIVFVAKYLNVMSLDSEKVNEWYNNGALDDEYPVHIADNDNWEKYKYNEKQINLYPFNHEAIITLYNNIGEHKTPRYILRDIVEKVVNEIIYAKEKFPYFLINRRSPLDRTQQSRISNIVNNMQLEKADKELLRDRLIALIGFWGNEVSESYSSRTDINGIKRNVFEEFGLETFFDLFTNMEKLRPEENDVKHIIPKPIIKPEEQHYPLISDEQVRYDSFNNIVDDWFHNKKNLVNPQSIRDEICNFIFGTINWQQEGIPLIAKKMVQDSSYKLIAFERQDVGQDKGLVILPASEDTRELLLCFAGWYHLGKKTWSFKNATQCVFFATSWLERHKSAFINLVRDNYDSFPVYMKAAMLVDIYRKALNGEFKTETLITPEVFTNEYKEINTSATGHTDTWNSYLKEIYTKYADKNHKQIIDYFNIMQGISSSGGVKKYIINYTYLDEAVNAILTDNLTIPSDTRAKGKIKTRNDNMESYSCIKKNISNIIKEEINYSKCIIEELHKYFGFDEKMQIEIQDLRDILNDIRRLYKLVKDKGMNIALKNDEATSLLGISKDIIQCINITKKDYSSFDEMRILFTYSENPLEKVILLLNLFKNVDSDVDQITSDMKEKLETYNLLWSDNTDKRFTSFENEFNDLVERMEI